MNKDTPRILIAEDTELGQKLLAGILRDFGTCDIAADGNDAVAAFSGALNEGAPYHLIFMDIVMPGLDGQAALRQIRAIEQERNVSHADLVKVLMTTARTDGRSMMEAIIESKACSYILKPITPEKIEKELKQLGFFKIR